LQVNVPVMVIFNGTWFETLVLGDSYLVPLYIDRTNNRVGVGTASPLARLSVDPGVIQINQNATSTNNFFVTAADNDGKLKIYNGNYNSGSLRAELGSNYAAFYGPSSNSSVGAISAYGGAGNARKLHLVASSDAGSWTGIASAGDSSIVAAGASVDTQDLVIATWNSLSAGIKLQASTGFVGINETSPLAALHLKHSAPTVLLQDADHGASVYGTISASGSAGSLAFSADPNNAAASTTLQFAIDGTTVAEANSIGNFGFGVTPTSVSGKSIWAHSSTSESYLYLTNSTTGASANQGTMLSSSGYNAQLRALTQVIIQAGPDIGTQSQLTLSTSAATFSDRLNVNGITDLGLNFPQAYATFYGKQHPTTGDYETELVANGSGADVSIRLTTKGAGRLYCQAVYDRTSGSAANVVVGSTGGLVRSTSSMRYKKNVQDFSKGLSHVESLRAVTFETKNLDEAGARFVGLIAEEVETADLKELVIYSNGQPDALAYDRFCAVLVNAVKELAAKVRQLEARLA
jgi:hypothetical protein